MKKLCLVLALLFMVSKAHAVPPYYVDTSGNIHGTSATLSGLTASLPLASDANKKIVTMTAANFLALIGAVGMPGAGVPNSTGTTWGSSYTLTTSLGNPGIDTNIPSEKAVRAAIQTGFAAPYIDWNAVGGGASILNKPTLGTAALVDTGTAPGKVWLIPTDPAANVLWGWDDTDNLIKPITIGANLSYDHATHTLSAAASSGMSNPMTTIGDMIYSSDGSGTGARLGMAAAAGKPLISGGTGQPPAWAAYIFSGTSGQTYTFPSTSKTILANDLSNLTIASQAQGDIIYFNGTNWVRLGIGTSGYFLKSQGAGANPVWAANTTAAAGSDTQIQFNDGGTALAGAAEFFWNKTSHLVTIGGANEAEQLRLRYDGSNYASVAIGSTGSLTVAATGTNPNITLTPGGTGYTILNGKVGINTATPAVTLDIPAYSLTNSAFRAGSFEVQAVALNNSITGDNLYYNGAWKYRNNGYGSTLWFVNGKLLFQTAPSGTGGATVVPALAMIIANSGRIGVNTDLETLPSTFSDVQFVSKNSVGGGAILGWASTSGAAGGSQGTQGLSAYVINDNTSNASSAYGQYILAVRTNSAALGTATHGLEIATVSGATDSPEITISSTPTGLTSGLWLSSGKYDGGSGDNGGASGSYPVSVGIGMINNNTSGYNAYRVGLVMFANSLTDIGSGYQHAILVPNLARICWGDYSHCITGNINTGKLEMTGLSYP